MGNRWGKDEPQEMLSSAVPGQQLRSTFPWMVRPCWLSSSSTTYVSKIGARHPILVVNLMNINKKLSSLVGKVL